MFSNKTEEKEEDHAPLLVIGAGIGRTGTLTLKTALEILYNKPCYHMVEVVYKHLDHVKLWTQLHDRMEQDMDAELPPDVIKRIFNGYQMTTDNPGCTIYKQLMKIYPEAKVILTTRDPNTWIQSLRETVRPKDPLFGSGWLDKMKERLVITAGFSHMVDQSIVLSLGSNVSLDDDEQMKQAFVRRNDEVKRTVPSHRLLVFHVKDGWEPLCQFLGKPIPDVPFPHVNDRETLKKRIRRIRLGANCLIAFSVVLLGVGLASGIFWFRAT